MLRGEKKVKKDRCFKEYFNLLTRINKRYFFDIPSHEFGDIWADYQK